MQSIGCSETGSGKSMAFIIPIIQSLARNPIAIYAVIIEPTRELAYQMLQQIQCISKQISLRLCILIGGVDINEQRSSVERIPHIVYS